MRVIALAVSILLCTSVSWASEHLTVITDSVLQTTKDPQPHGYVDSSRFHLHGFALGEQSLHVFLHHGTIADSTRRVELVGRITDSMTGESVEGVRVSIGAIDSSSAVARILVGSESCSAKDGQFSIVGTVSNGTVVAFFKAGYFVTLYEVNRLRRASER
jgi:hypothetical protein